MVKLNLQKIEKNLQKNYILEVLRLLEAKFQKFFFYFWILSKNGASSEGIFLIGGLTKKIKIFRSWFLIGHWLLNQMNSHTIEGLVSAFQNLVKIWSKFWQNFRGLFGAFKTLFRCNQRYRWMPPYGYSRFLMSKTNFKNLILRIQNYDPWDSFET